jgi:hypothetical protein
VVSDEIDADDDDAGEDAPHAHQQRRSIAKVTTGVNRYRIVVPGNPCAVVVVAGARRAPLSLLISHHPSTAHATSGVARSDESAESVAVAPRLVKLATSRPARIESR